VDVDLREPPRRVGGLLRGDRRLDARHSLSLLAQDLDDVPGGAAADAGQQEVGRAEAPGSTLVGRVDGDGLVADVPVGFEPAVLGLPRDGDLLHGTSGMRSGREAGRERISDTADGSMMQQTG
jgi:hypothetical protein